MKLINLELLNFRNYEKIKLEFNSKFNLIYGNNGGGKTNIVEAIYLLAYTKSFRTTNDKHMIKFDKQLLKVSGDVLDNNFTNHYSIVINDEGKKVKINETNYNRLSDYISKINIILFCRDDLDLIKESPLVRRKNINMDISGFNNYYLKKLNLYNKVLKQRNSYLKSLYLNNNLPKDYLDILTSNLVKVGKEIYLLRKEFIDNINKYLNTNFNKIVNISSNLELKYVSDFSLKEEDILKKYRTNYGKEMQFGKTLFGIHHDDFNFYLDNKIIKYYGSEGQQKNAIIAYKLSLIDLLNDINIKPIFILDDMFSELDNEKIDNILNLLDLDLQIFITTTDISNVSDNIKNNANEIHVDNAKVEVI